MTAASWPFSEMEALLGPLGHRFVFIGGEPRTGKTLLAQRFQGAIVADVEGLGRQETDRLSSALRRLTRETGVPAVMTRVLQRRPSDVAWAWSALRSQDADVILELRRQDNKDTQVRVLHRDNGPVFFLLRFNDATRTLDFVESYFGPTKENP